MTSTPTPTLSTWELRVPTARADDAAWLCALAPERAADALALARAAHALATTEGDDGRREVATDELVATLRASFEARQRKHAEVLRDEHARAVATYEAQVDELRRALEARDADHAAARQRVDARLHAVQTELDEVVERRESQRAREREAGDARVDAVRRDCEAAMERADARHAAELARLAQAAESAVERDRALTHVEELLTSLVGAGADATNRRGELGEALVRHVHDALALGTLVPNPGKRAAGFADATWTYDAGGGAPPLVALVEVKCAATADGQADVGKFLKDVDAAVRTGRVGAAVYLSLRDRIGGRRFLELQLVHGVPVLWASRAADDEVSASALVRAAFTALATAWPLLSRASAGASSAEADARCALEQVAVLLNAQLDEAAKLEPRVAFLERTSDQLRKEAGLLRRTRDALVSNVDNFHARFPHLPVANDPDAEALERTAVAAIESYYAAHHNRYPKDVSELQRHLDSDTLAALQRRPQVYQTCERRVRAAKQGPKRRRVDDGGGAGAGTGAEGGPGGAAGGPMDEDATAPAGPLVDPPDDVA